MLTLFMGQSPSYEANNRSNGEEILSCYKTQRFITMFTRPTTGLYLESDESSLHYHRLFLEAQL